MQQAFEQEARIEYDRALKLGKREYAARVSRGERGNLLVLDEIVGQNSIMAYVRRPAMEIPLSDVAGTYTSGRAHSFAANFMPLSPDGSEFSGKWQALCAAHLGEGLRDPVQVYEYMWKYYVVEGNKRVSVLKYFDAPTVRAEITRMIPQLDPNDAETGLYYAFLQYDKQGMFKGLRLDSAEKYQRMAALEAQLIPQEERNDPQLYNSIYIQFVMAVKKARIPYPVGDVMTEYLRLYGLPRDTVLSELTQQVSALVPQLALLSRPQEPTLLLDKKEEQPPTLVQRLFSPKRTANVLFAYDEAQRNSGWVGAHEKGRLALEKELGDKVRTVALDGLTPENCYEQLTEHSRDMHLVLITSGYLMNAALRFQLEHPDIMVMVYSRVRQDARLGTYYGRYYEASFLAGVTAGYATKKHKVAYVTPYTEKRYTPDINAFGLGVKTVSPDARVLLMQRGVSPFDPQTCKNGLLQAAALGADVAMCPLYDGIELPGVPSDVFSAVLRLSETGEPRQFISAPAWDWGRYYVEIVKAFLSGSLDMLAALDRGETGVAGLWWGLGTGVLKFRMADFVPPAAGNMVRYLRSSIALGRFNPFHGPVYDQENVLRIPEHTDPKPYDILNMEWLADFICVID